MAREIALVVFDKDGTLVEHGMWPTIFGRVLDTFIDEARRPPAAEAVGYDLQRRAMHRDASVMGSSNESFIATLLPFAGVDDADVFHRDVEARCAAWALQLVRPVAEATPVLQALRRQGVDRAVCTNDAAAATTQQLQKLGWRELFSAVLGYDSGHGAKPGPGMVVAALEAHDCAATDALMVGDSPADVAAARAAGVASVYVGTNPAVAEDADHVIGSLDQLLPLVGLV